MIRIRGLRKVYPDGKVAVGDIDLDLDTGMIGLLGPNGAGKSTFLSMLSLNNEPTGGSREYFGLDAATAAKRKQIRGWIGYLPQNFSSIPYLTGKEYLLYCACLRGVPLSMKALRSRANDLLERVDLVAAMNRRSGEYSGGMRRRLGLAQALIHSPRFLMLDEPTAGLDPEERIRFRNLISDVSSDTIVLLSTHIVEDVEATCPRIVLINSGQKIYDGEPGVILARFANRLWEAPADRLPAGVKPVGRQVDGAGRVTVTFLSDTAVEGAEQHEPSLEEAYAAFLIQRGISMEEAV